jgi:arylsulfatase A
MKSPFTLLLLILSAVASCTTGYAKEPPNFVFIMTDDQGYGDLGCYGHPTIKTPNIDAMATHGVRFTDCYARHKCSPARASLMSGAFNFRVGVGAIVYPHSSVGMCKETVTIPEMLKEIGYTSALVGKWHLGHALGYLPTDQGFDSYFGVPGTNHGDAMNHGLPVADGFKPGGGLTMKDYKADADKGTHGRSTILMRDDRVIEWPTDITQLTKRYTHEAVKFIKENKDKPFFLYIAHGTPHHPYTVDRSFRGKSAHGLYGDMIEEIDWSVGQVIKALKENGLERKTIVAFTSDNGADSKPDRNGNEEKGSNLPLKGWKGSSDEGGVRVPFVVTWPGTLPEGKETREMASLMDILPTFAALAGIEPKTPQKIDGKDIFPVMQCLPDVKSPHKYIYYAGNIARITGARNERFKLIRRGKPALYDLQSDPGETKDVAADHPEVLQELQGAIEAFQKDLDEHSLEAPFDAGQAAYKKGKEEKPSRKKTKRKRSEKK